MYFVLATQHNAKSAADLSKSLESTRAHLQGQLRSKEAENNRLSVQIKVCRVICGSRHQAFSSTVVCVMIMWLINEACCFPLVQNQEQAASQRKGVMEHLKEQLVRLKQQAAADREALKQATRAQRQRAQRGEDTAGQLSLQLLDLVGPRPRAQCTTALH